MGAFNRWVEMVLEAREMRERLLGVLGRLRNKQLVRGCKFKRVGSLKPVLKATLFSACN